MNRRTVTLQILVFVIQWTLMLLGFGLLAVLIAPASLVPSTIPFSRVVDAGVKAAVALLMSVFWLFIWDRQVRFLFYRKDH